MVFISSYFLTLSNVIRTNCFTFLVYIYFSILLPQLILNIGADLKL